MIRLYTGEYLYSPYLLHFGLNRCSHGCIYCFANLNRPDRQTEAADLLKIERWFSQGSTCVEFELLQAGHPVLVANDSDPCAKSNQAAFEALHESSRRHGYRLVYQTRGGEAEAEARILSDAPTSVYVSLTTDRDDIVSQYEPGCPRFSQRMDFISRLKKAGHHVIIGLNPFIPAWWDDLRGSFAQLHAAGVSHVWHQPIHMSRFQLANMPDAYKKRHADFIDYATKRVAPDANEYTAGLMALERMGFNLLRGGISEHLGFWDAYFSLGFPFVPTLDAFVRDCNRHAGGAPVMVSLQGFTDWARVFEKDRSIYKEFLVKIGRNIRNVGEKTESAKSMHKVHEFLWRLEEFPTIFRSNAFARVAYQDGWAGDDEGIPLLAVSAEGFDAPEISDSGAVFLDSPLERRW